MEVEEGGVEVVVALNSGSTSLYIVYEENEFTFLVLVVVLVLNSGMREE